MYILLELNKQDTSNSNIEWQLCKIIIKKKKEKFWLLVTLKILTVKKTNQIKNQNQKKKF